MKLYLMRHGEAVPRAASDPTRALTPRGLRQVEDVATRREDDLDTLELVVASPYLRARQTAEEIMRMLGHRGDLLISAQLRPDADIRALGALVNTCTVENLLLVSHQPLVGATLAWLTGREELAAMGTADLAALELTAFAPGGAHLLWLERGA